MISDWVASPDGQRTVENAARAMWEKAYPSGNANEWDAGEAEFWAEEATAALRAALSVVDGGEPCAECFGRGWIAVKNERPPVCPSCEGRGTTDALPLLIPRERVREYAYIVATDTPGLVRLTFDGSQGRVTDVLYRLAPSVLGETMNAREGIQRPRGRPPTEAEGQPF